MPRYFFDVYDERITSQDSDGILCADPRTVGTTAHRILAEIAAEGLLHAAQAKLYANVRDEAGCVVYTAALSFTGSWLQVPMATPATQLELRMA